MKCNRVREKLASYCDGELDPADRLKITEHLDQCPPCNQLYCEMKQYSDFINHYHLSYQSSETPPDLQNMQQNIMSHIVHLKEEETSWNRFWNSRPALYLSYSTAAIFFVFIVSLVVNTYVFDNTGITDSDSSAISQGLDNETYNPADTLGQNYQDSVVASPVRPASSPQSYTFELVNNQMITTYHQNGQQLQRVRDINFRELQEMFGKIAIEYGLYESNICPECAQDYFNSVLKNDYLNGSPLKEEARQYLSQFVSNE